MTRTVTIPGLGNHTRTRGTVLDRLRAHYAPGMEALTRALPEHPAGRLEHDVLLATGLQDYAHLGALIVVECSETGWCGVASSLVPVVPGAAA